LQAYGRYEIDDAFFMSVSVSSTVSNRLEKLNAPPELMANAVAAIDILSGASHKLQPSWSTKAYQKP
jgi:hypothetical protein